jgi:hypothetical protein
MPPRVQRNAILVATHKDSFYSDEDCAQVLRRLKDMTSGLFREVVLVSASAATNPFDAPGETPDDSAEIHAAIDTVASVIRIRRIIKAQRIVQRLSRLALHEFGRNAIRPESVKLFAHWNTLSDRILDDHRARHLAIDQAMRGLLHAFAQVAESIRPGVVMPSRSPAYLNGARYDDTRNVSMVTNPAALRADLTAVLRIIASASPYESPQSREQREAARATLIALADLDTILLKIGHWLKAAQTAAPQPPVISA